MASIGAAFVRGRVTDDTAEVGSPTRAAGQYTSYLSCPIRSSGSHRMRLPIQTITPTAGNVLLHLQPDNAYNAGGQDAFGRFFSWVDPSTTGAATLSGNEITDAIRTAGAQGDRATPPAGIGIWPASTNRIVNGGFESNTTGWVAYGADVAIARITSDYAFGVACCEVTVGAGGSDSGLRHTAYTNGAAVTAGVTYTSSAWVRSISGLTAGYLVIDWYTGAGAYLSSTSSSPTWTTSWARYTVTGLAPATAEWAVVNVRERGAGAATFRVDGIQVEALAVATPYIETNGGTAARSASRARLTVADLGITATQGIIAFRWVPGWSAAQEPGAGSSYIVLWDWKDDSNNRIILAYEESTNRYFFQRISGGVADTVYLAASPVAGTGATITCAWTSTTLYASLDGAAFSSTGCTHIPTLAATTMDVGSDAATQFWLYGDVRWVVSGKGTRTDADATALHAYGSVPPVSGQLLAALNVSFAPALLYPCVTSAYEILSGRGIEAWYDKTNTRITLRRYTAGVGAAVTATWTQAAAAASAILLAWDSANLYAAVDGGTIQSVANTSIPTLTTVVADVGSHQGVTNYFDALYAAAASISGAVLTAAQWTTLSGLKAARPPVFGDASTAMTMLWYGANKVVWTLPATGALIDLNYTLGNTVILEKPYEDAGPEPVVHRVVVSPLRGGETYINTVSGVRRVIVTVALISRSDREAMWALRRTLSAAVAPHLGQGLLLYAPATRVYEIMAILENSGAPLSDPIGALATRAVLPFRCSEGDWLESIRVDTTGTIALAGWTLPWSLPWSLTSLESAISVTNSGDVPVWPVIVVTAGAGGCEVFSIENVTTGHTLRMLNSSSMVAGDELVIDMAARSITVNSINAMPDRDPDSEMWSLAPGVNALVARLARGSATVTVQYVPRLVGV